MKFIFNNTKLWVLLLSLPLIMISACKKDEGGVTITIKEGPNAAADAQLAFIDAEDGTTIIFEEGTFEFTNTLSLDGKNNIIIMGAGRDLTYIDFANQTSGGDGVLVTNCTNVRFENLTVRDSEGDALKTKDCDGVSFVNVGTVWSGVPDANNGAYGLYPVKCSRVYIDNCYAFGASDAGIYVGQSNQVIVKNCLAEGNVAGIEIENTISADVFDNVATDNTGGILIFDLPGLTQYGENVRVFNNNCYDNNRTNFAPAGNIVGNVPAGTGLMVLSTNDVEIFDNIFDNNNFAGVLIASYLFIEPNPNDPNFQPLPYNITIHDNSYPSMGAVNPTQPTVIAQLMGLLSGNGLDQPNIMMDGIYVLPQVICVKEPVGTSLVNLNAAADDTFGSISTDLTPHDCTRDALPEVSFEVF